MSATLEQSLQARTTATTEARATVWSRLFAPAASAPLVYFRIAFGAIMLWEVWRYFEYNWIYRYYIQPTFFFSYFPFDWLPPLPGDLMYLFFYGMALLAVLVMVGLYYRASMTLFFLGFTYWFLLDHTNYLNHFYLIALVSFIMIFLPAHRRLSLDAALKPSLRGDTIPAWALWLLRFQIGVAYFYGGIAKINPDWLQATPMNYWLAARTDFPLIGHLFTEMWMHYFFSYGGLFFDLLVIPALLWRPTRNFALLVAVMFHLTNARLFNIGIFPWFMIAATLILFAPAWLTKHRLWRLGGAPANLPEFTPQPLTSAQRWTLALVGVFVVWQVLMPLRHWLYPGYVSWTEEGHNFSWHMKLRGKSGSLSLYVFDPDSYSTEAVNLRDHLTPRQIDKMSTRPHMMLQFAHYLADQQRAQGRDNFSIHARAWVSLNGRDWQLMIDPQVDLASQPRDIWHKTWVLPLTTPLFADEGARIIVGGD
jgi:vitamin K-dependent gamma-carboxylase